MYKYKLFIIAIIVNFLLSGNYAYAATKVYAGDGMVEYLDDSSITVTEFDHDGYIAGCFHIDYDDGSKMDGTAYMAIKVTKNPDFAVYFINEYDMTNQDGESRHIHRNIVGNVFETNAMRHLYLQSQLDMVNDIDLLNKAAKYM